MAVLEHMELGVEALKRPHNDQHRILSSNQKLSQPLLDSFFQQQLEARDEFHRHGHQLQLQPQHLLLHVHLPHLLHPQHDIKTIFSHAIPSCAFSSSIGIFHDFSTSLTNLASMQTLHRHAFFWILVPLQLTTLLESFHFHYLFLSTSIPKISK